MKLYNTLTRKKEEFVPFGDVVTYYNCGPTVYSLQHIGNMKAAIVSDVIRRVIKYNGYKLNQCMNITDVGHIVSDADQGEDKMVKASKSEHKTPEEIAKYYTDLYMIDRAKLNIENPENIVPATSVIPDIIKFVQKILENGYAYETSKGIYFDVEKFKGYGKLSRMNLEEKLAGARIEVDSEKKNPADFTLWVKAPKEHIMQWPSPWGMGYPGWHIECSAIGKKYLGEHIDLHIGGVEHISVHHENEIAQNFAYAGFDAVKYWLHFEHLMVNGEKMSKSLGNIDTVSSLEKEGFDPMALRLFFLTAQYSKQQNFTKEALKSAQDSLINLYRLTLQHKDGKDNVENEQIEKWREEFKNAVSDDFNTPQGLATVWSVLKNKEKSQKIYDLLLDFDKVLGLKINEAEQNLHSLLGKHEIPEEIQEISEKRWNAKKNRDFAESDRLRNLLDEKGWVVLDSKDSYELQKK